MAAERRASPHQGEALEGMTGDEALQGVGRHYTALTDEQLVAALRRGDTQVLTEFVHRFQRIVLGQARRYGIPISERRAWVLELLHDVAMGLMRPGTPMPRSVRAYLVRASHHRWVDGCRTLARRRLPAEPESSAERTLDEAVVLESHSEYSYRSSRGPDWEAVALSPVLERLASTLEEGLTLEERRLLSWVSQDVPHHEIARVIGISRSGVAQRVRRLRARLYEAAKQHVFDADPGERAELMRFLRRTAVYHERDLACIEPERS
jgi:RNA polymerase sigma factor (sigma-70 family)